MKYEFYDQEERNQNKITAAVGAGVIVLAIGTVSIIANNAEQPGICDTVSARYDESGTDIANRAFKDLGVPRDSINRTYAGQDISREITKSTNNKYIMPGNKITICVNESKTEVTDLNFNSSN